MENPDKQEKIVHSTFNQKSGEYASWYDGQTLSSHSFQMRRQRMLEVVAKEKPGKVLDIGCGPGVTVGHLLDMGHEVWGVDIAHGMIDQCSRTFGDRPNAHFSLGRIEKLEFPDGFFDVVVCLGVVEYLIDDSVAIQEMHRVLRPGGLAVISCPNYWSPWRRWDALYWRIAVPVRKMLGREPYSEMIHREYRQGAYCGLLEKHGFRVEDVAYYNFKTIPTPIDRKLVKLSLGISRRLEGQSRGLLKRLATGFNVAVRKPAESAPAPAAPAAG